jgi:hypothetical protein
MADKATLEALWTGNGGNPAKADIASAVALAESDGDQYATDNDSDGSVDRGYWQINSVHGALSTYDANGNTKAAIAISANGTDWSAWVTYNSGAYEKFLSAPSTAGTQTPVGASAGTASVANTTGSTSASASSSGPSEWVKLLLDVAFVGFGAAAIYKGSRKAIGAAA